MLIEIPASLQRIVVGPQVRGIAIELARPVNQRDDVEVSDDDISAMGGIPRVDRALRMFFGKDMRRTLLARSLLHYYLPEGEQAVEYHPEQIHADMQHASDQLIANAQRDSPLRHQQALDSPDQAKLLESFSSAFRQHRTRVYVCYGGVGYIAPILEAGDFVEPVVEDTLEQTGTFRITALRRDFETGRTGFGIGRDELPVDLPNGDPRWGWDAVKDVLDASSYLVGTIHRASRGEPWRPLDDMRLERQQGLPVIDAA